MQSACFFEDSGAGAQVEVIGVAQDDLGFHLLFQLRDVHAFNRADGPYGHKYRGLYGAVVGGYHACAGVTVFVLCF